MERILSVVGILWLQFHLGWSNYVQKAYRTSNPVRNFDAVLNDENITYIAGKNHIVVVDRLNSNLTTINIPPTDSLLRACKAGQNTREDSICTNSMKVIERFNTTHLIACGTNVLNPSCYYVSLKTHTFTESSFRVSNYLPNEPSIRVATTFSSVDSNPQMYSAFCRDPRSCSFSRFFNSSTNLILAHPRNSFRSPTFLNIYFSEREEKHVYLFYREVQNIFDDESFTSNGVDQQYGMVARVCHSDTGGSLHFGNRFMTFMRARLLCPVRDETDSNRPGSLFYNNLKSTYKIGNIIYGLFTLPRFWPHKGSAVCAYDLDTIDAFIEGTVFPKNVTQYYDPNSATLTNPYPSHDNVRFLPGRCPGSGHTTRQVDAVYLDFIRSSRTLIGKPVEPIGGKPVETFNENYDFILASENPDSHLLYLFKDNGFMTKARVMPSTLSKTFSTNLLFETQLFDNNTILSASLANDNIMVVTKHEIFQVKLSICENYGNCSSCETDPHCNWIIENDHYVCAASQDPGSDETSCSAPPSPPPKVVIRQNYPTVSIEWEAGGSDVPTTGYQVELQRKSDSLISYRIVSRNRLRIDEKMLTRGSRYHISIFAINNKTLSRIPTKRDFSTTLEKPTLRVEEVTNSMAKLSWSAVEKAAFYNISIFSSASGQLTQSYVTKSSPSLSDQTFAVTGLKPRESYSVQIFAVSQSKVESSRSVQNFTTAALTTPSPSSTSRTFVSSSLTTALIRTKSFVNLQSTQTGISAFPPNTSNNVEKALNSVTNIVSQTSMDSASQYDVTTTAFVLEPVRIYRAGIWSPLTILLIVFMALSVILLLVVAQNRYSIGSKTKEIKTGNDSKTLKRKYYFFWSSSERKGFHPGQSVV